MESFEPLINLLTVLTVLSLAAERATNLLKMRQPDLRNKTKSAAAERDREYRISIRSFIIGIGIATIAKADFFQILTHLDNPWGTFGWLSVSEHRWVRSPSTASIGAFLYTLGGCAITGATLGFGSKFWHDILGTVYEIRNVARNRAERGAPPAQGGTADGN